MAIVPRCEYCKNNEGENKEFGYMWHCKALGYCVPFGYRARFTKSNEFQYCKAAFIGKGYFEADEAKYREYKKKNKA